MKYVAFDLEITKEIPQGESDWKAFRPLGISCAATLTSDGASELWHGAYDNETKCLAGKMTPQRCQWLAQSLCEMHAEGYQIVTINGLGFDFDILAEECQSLEWFDNCRELALSHIDIFFAMFCEKGYGVGLDTACKGMGVAGKIKGMHGAKAPVLWAQSYEDQQKVLEYVKQDVQATADLYEAILKHGVLRWTSRKGRPNVWFLPDEGGDPVVPIVSEALKLTEPDTSWMSAPWPRSKFYGWTE